MLSQCNYVPELWVNLFSVGKALKNGYSLSNKGVIMTLAKNQTKLIFERIFKTGQGFVAGVNLVPKPVRENAMLGLQSKRINMNAAHSCMSHVGEEATRNTAKYYGLTVAGKLDAKSNRNIIPKKTSWNNITR